MSYSREDASFRRRSTDMGADLEAPPGNPAWFHGDYPTVNDHIWHVVVARPTKLIILSPPFTQFVKVHED